MYQIKKLKIPESNREVFLVLAENNLFPTEYLELIYKMIGVRNIIVHSYDKVDDSLVYVILKKNLKDIRKILKLLQEKNLKYQTTKKICFLIFFCLLLQV